MLGVFFVLVSGCVSKEAKDYAVVSRCVDAYRATPGSLDAIGQLEACACSTPGGCKLREVCMRSSGAMKKALTKKAGVLKTLENKGLSLEERSQGLTQIDEAEALVKQAKEALVECDTEEQSLRRSVRR
jgi:hypothetical protein